ncbi:hypothetical protein ACFT9J_16905, partial [Streptomyces anthocyanicus]|uniref:hypothetical protein n=1 Tax=Streptomyces anthocyanicus TaxID=68174 RepID=UPI00363FC977
TPTCGEQRRRPTPKCDADVRRAVDRPAHRAAPHSRTVALPAVGRLLQCGPREPAPPPAPPALGSRTAHDADVR